MKAAMGNDAEVKALQALQIARSSDRHRKLLERLWVYCAFRECGHDCGVVATDNVLMPMAAAVCGQTKRIATASSTVWKTEGSWRTTSMPHGTTLRKWWRLQCALVFKLD